MAKPAKTKKSGTRILLIDASHTFLQVITRFLCERGDAVVVGMGRNGEDILAKAQDLQPEIVLIDPLTSISNQSALELIARLRAALPQAGIIVLSLMSFNNYRQAVLDAGADDFVPKPAAYKALLPAIQRVVGTKRPAQTALTGRESSAE